MLSILSRTYQVLSIARSTRRRLPPTLLQRAGRSWVDRAVGRQGKGRPADVTVLIGTRNRADHRLANSLRSLCEQPYPAELLRAVVVDYGSEPEDAERTELLCAEHRAEYVRVDGVSVWSRSRCLNVGIRRAATTLFLTSDVDILFSPGYVADAVAALTRPQPAYVCAAMLDLPEESAEVVERTARTGNALQLDAWKARSRPRHDWEHHPSICLTYTAVLQAIRGYDEFYETWGWEDYDLARRLEYLGLGRRLLDSGSFYLHQWHPESERGRDGLGAAIVERNRQHFKRTHSIVRNDRNWGIPSPTRSTL
jgi:GT2 family glycosyltransferase